MKTFTVVALFVASVAIAAPRTLQAPKKVADIERASVRSFECPQILVSQKTGGGVKFVQKPHPSCVPSFVVEFHACATYEDGGKSQDCGTGKIRVKADDAALQTLWNAARVEWEKAKGY